ncbi:MAG: type II CAAX endopeptidase family protein [Candidatus Saccharibacteria bacterium]
MLENSLNNTSPGAVGRNHSRRFLTIVGLTTWVFSGFYLGQFLLLGIVWLLEHLGVTFVVDGNPALQTTLAAIAYVLALSMVVGVPWVIGRHKTTKKDIGLTRLPSWMDIVLSPAGFVIYLLASAGLIALISVIVPHFNIDQAQDVGFQNLSDYYQYVLAFLTLVVIAPLAEEILFRGYLYGKLKKHIPFWVAMIVTSLLFGALHGQWNVAIDTFALSIVMCSLREVTGSIWAGILLHMIKNGVAFYFLFINTSILHTLGG